MVPVSLPPGDGTDSFGKGGSDKGSGKGGNRSGERRRFSDRRPHHKKLCGSMSISSLIEPFGFGPAASHWRK